MNTDFDHRQDTTLKIYIGVRTQRSHLHTIRSALVVSYKDRQEQRPRNEIQKLKDQNDKIAEEKDQIIDMKNCEIDELKQEKFKLEEIIESLDIKLDEIAKQNELRDRLLEESIEKGKELEDELHK